MCDHTRRNPAGLPNDAGTEYANVKCLGSGKMEAARDIAIGEELYWCYGEKYWKYWSTRPARNKLTKTAAEAAAWAVAGMTTAGGTPKRETRVSGVIVHDKRVSPKSVQRSWLAVFLL